MAVSTWKQVLFNEGEGVDPDDINDAQRFCRALVMDGVVRPYAARELVWETGSDVLYTSRCYAMAGGGAPKPTATAREVACSSGTIMQALATEPDGDEDTLVPYRLDNEEVKFQLAVGDGTHPRIDLVQVKLEHFSATVDPDPDTALEDGAEVRDFEDGSTRVVTSVKQQKRRWTKITASVKAGTPAASPVRPTPDAGYVALWGVHVPQNHNAVFDEDHLQDLRFPAMGPRTDYRCGAELFVVAGWVPNAAGGTTAANAGDTCLLLASNARSAARLLSADWYAVAGGGTPIQVDLVRIDWSAGAIATATVVANLANRAAGQAYSTAAKPVWASGYESPANWSSPPPTANTILALLFTAGQTGDVIGFASMEFGS